MAKNQPPGGQAPVVQRVRIRYAKRGPLRFTSHRDFARAFERAIHRVMNKLLHQTTVRVKELANHSGDVSDAAALAELFALSPEAVEAVTRAEGL